MENQEKFMEMIQDIVTLAKMNRREVTREFLNDYLKELGLNEKQMEFVCDYLIQENIKVAGYPGKAKSEKTQQSVQEAGAEESEYLSLYLKEIQQRGSKNQVSMELYEKAAGGDAQAKAFIIEQKLTRVIDIAKKFKNQGVSQSDLIQEGNIGLLLAVEQLEGRAGQEEQFLDQEIENSIIQAIDLYKEEKRENSGLMKKVETLKEEMEKLSEDFGDKMTSDDVAQFTGMELEEIQSILRMTGEEL